MVFIFYLRFFILFVVSVSFIYCLCGLIHLEFLELNYLGTEISKLSDQLISFINELKAQQSAINICKEKSRVTGTLVQEWARVWGERRFLLQFISCMSGMPFLTIGIKSIFNGIGVVLGFIKW